MTDYDVVILGAGAAGLMCAITAGRRGRRVLVLDHASEVGAKILISGGGRCNFTNTGTAPERFLSENPNFCRSALGRYTPQDFVAMVEQHGIRFHEKSLGQLFCDGSARAIGRILLDECEAVRVEVRLAHRVVEASRSDSFHIETDQGPFKSSSLVLGTGGLSIPKLGATGFAHDVALPFGLRLTELRPGLVPLTFSDDLLALMRSLNGVSLDSELVMDRHRFHAAMLFTHRCLSGPAILQISSYWKAGPITMNFLPGRDAPGFLLERKRARPKAELRNVLADVLPQRLTQALAATVDTATAKPGRSDAVLSPATRMAELPDRILRDLASRLSAWAVTPSGSEGYAKAEVTCGGVDTRTRRHARCRPTVYQACSSTRKIYRFKKVISVISYSSTPDGMCHP